VPGGDVKNVARKETKKGKRADKAKKRNVNSGKAESQWGKSAMPPCSNGSSELNGSTKLDIN